MSEALGTIGNAFSDCWSALLMAGVSGLNFPFPIRFRQSS